MAKTVTVNELTLFDKFRDMFPNLYSMYLEFRPSGQNTIWVWLMDNTQLLFKYTDEYHWSLKTV